MNKYKIAILLLTVSITAWLIGCASTPDQVGPDDGIKVEMGGYIEASTIINTGH
jgi:hypothetical protein